MGTSEKNRIKVGLAAYGMSGRVFHAPLLCAHHGFLLSKVLERKHFYAKEKYPDVAVVTQFNELLNDQHIELIVVNTPEHTHFDMAKAALEANKHVVVEKAFTVTSAQAAELIALSEQQGKMLSVFQNSRWHGDFLTLQKIINSRLLGELVAFEAHYDRFRNSIQPGAWKEEALPGTGVLYNLGSHMIDQVLVLFGKPQAVAADIRTQRTGGNVDDNFELILFYEKLKATLKSSYLVREPGPRYALYGSEGSFMKYGGDPQEAMLKAGQIPFKDWGIESEVFWGKLNTQINRLHFVGSVETLPGSYPGYYDNIYEVIRNGAALIVKPEQALQTIAIIEAAYQSALEKRTIDL